MSIYRKKIDAFLHYLLDIVEGRRKDNFSVVVISLLSLLSYLYRAIVFIRLKLYAVGIFKTRSFGCLSISVGNISIGGTGKTPVVEMLAAAFNKNGRKVAILSRGYKKREAPLLKRLYPSNIKKKFRVVSDGEGVLLDVLDSGDEPYMLAKNVPGSVVLVGKDRVLTAEYAVSRYGADTLILDDGFQYLSFGRKLDVVLIDITNPFGNGHLLPRGTLRESKSSLKRADVIFLTKVNPNPTAKEKENIEEIRAQILSVKPNADIIECTHAPQYLKRIGADQILPLEDLKGKKICVFSGIARPESFKDALVALGADIVSSTTFTDHHRYTVEEINKIMQNAAGKVDMVITTEKDAVRVPKEGIGDIPCYYLRVEVAILKGEDVFNDCISRLSF